MQECGSEQMQDLCRKPRWYFWLPVLCVSLCGFCFWAMLKRDTGSFVKWIFATAQPQSSNLASLGVAQLCKQERCHQVKTVLWVILPLEESKWGRLGSCRVSECLTYPSGKSRTCKMRVLEGGSSTITVRSSLQVWRGAPSWHGQRLLCSSAAPEGKSCPSSHWGDPFQQHKNTTLSASANCMGQMWFWPERDASLIVFSEHPVVIIMEYVSCSICSLVMESRGGWKELNF